MRNNLIGKSRNRGILAVMFSGSIPVLLLSVVLAAISGLANVSILPIVMYVSEGHLEGNLLLKLERTFSFLPFDISYSSITLMFFMYFILIILLKSISQILLTKVTLKSSLNLRLRLYNRISRSRTVDMERVGPSKLLNAINFDVNNIVHGAEEIPNFIVTLTTILGLVGYLFYIDPLVCLLAVGLIIFGLGSSRAPFFYVRRKMRSSRNLLDQIQEGVRGLIYGHKELKLNRSMLDEFTHTELFQPEEKTKALNLRAHSIMILAMNYGGMVTFFAIGLIVFFSRDYFELSNNEMMLVVMVFLYISAPLGKLVSLFSPITTARISLNKIYETLDELQEETGASTIQGGRNGEKIERITLKNVSHTYAQNDPNDRAFQLRNVDLEIGSGKAVFVVGGNGSGKTTLTKIISLLYSPNEGEVYFNDTAITDKNRVHYRQRITTVYSDFFLFQKLYGVDRKSLKQFSDQLLIDLELDKKVSIEKGKFSTIALSTGQKKRLALLNSLLQDKDIFIFDEWAADQDPVFRNVFYTKIIPALRERGKIVIAITHDDKYFAYSDVLVKLDTGEIVSNQEVPGYSLKRDEALPTETVS